MKYSKSILRYYAISYKSSYLYPIYKQSSQISLTVGSDGYTDYFVGDADVNCTVIAIKNENTGESFSHYFDNNTLKQGESGCFTIPTSSDLHGWTKE